MNPLDRARHDVPHHSIVVPPSWRDRLAGWRIRLTVRMLMRIERWFEMGI